MRCRDKLNGVGRRRELGRSVRRQIPNNRHNEQGPKLGDDVSEIQSEVSRQTAAASKSEACEGQGVRMFKALGLPEQQEETDGQPDRR